MLPTSPAFKTIIYVLVLLIVIALAGLFKLTSNASYLAYFNKKDPLVMDYLAKQRDFNIHDNLILIIKTKNDSSLTKSKNFYNNSKELINNLTALNTVQHIQDFLPQLRWRNNVLASPKQLNTSLLSKNANTALISLDVKLQDQRSAVQMLELNQKVLRLAQNQYQDSNLEYFLSGALGLNNAYIETVRHDLKRFIPFLLLSMLLALFYILGNIKLAIALIAIGLLSTLSAFGIIGWLGYSLASINIFTPIMIIGLSLVTNMHNTIAFYQRVADNNSIVDAQESSFKENLLPLTLSCLTTAVGFLFLLNSPSPPVVVTGIASALGITISLILSLTVLQSLLIKYAPTSKQAKALKSVNWAAPSAYMLTKYRRPVFIALLIIVPISVLGLASIKINDNVYHYFPKNYDFRKSLDILNEEFSGAASIDYIVTLNSRDNKPKTLQKKVKKQIVKTEIWHKNELLLIKDFISYLASSANVNQVYPMPSMINDNNLQRFYNKLPTSKSLLDTYIDKHSHKIRIQVRFNEMSASEILEFEKNIQKWSQRFMQQNQNVISIGNGTSPDILFANVSYNNAKSMFTSLIFALSLISIFTSFLLRSWRLGVLVFICNFLPIMIAYGALGLIGANLTLGSTVVIGMIIGIIVDDTLHLLFKYQRYSTTNTNTIEQLRYKVFPPVIISSFIIILALSVGLASDFKPTFEISLFSIVVISLALLTDIILLPMLLSLPFFTPKKNRQW
jgi:predicted RND superfamily exporter protein